MNLPTDIWINILINTTTVKECKKLYHSLSQNLQLELQKIYKQHKHKLNIEILISIKQKLLDYRNNKYKKSIMKDNEIIIFVKYVKNLKTKKGIRNCIVSSTKKGHIQFWCALSFDFIDEVTILSDITCLEFHPNQSLMATLSDDLKIWNITESGINCYRTQNIGYDKKIIQFHPVLTELYIYTILKQTTSYNQDINWGSKIYGIYMYDYNNDRLIYTDIIQSYLYINHLYTPIKMSEDGNVQCIKYIGKKNYIVTINIDDFVIKELKKIEIFRNDNLLDYFVIRDFIFIDECVYFVSNQSMIENEVAIFKQIDNKCSCIYKSTTRKLSKILYKNNMLIFIENNEYIIMNLENNNKEYECKIINDDLSHKIMDFCIV